MILGHTNVATQVPELRSKVYIFHASLSSDLLNLTALAIKQRLRPRQVNSVVAAFDFMQFYLCLVTYWMAFFQEKVEISA